MIRCLVTDRRRLCSAAASWSEQRRALVHLVRRAVDAHVDFIQVRERDLDAGALAALVDDVVAETRRTRTRALVNDRLDVALACGADGVHLRTDSIAAADVRRLAPRGFLISRAVHSVREAAGAGPVDLLIAGTVFRSRSKPDDAPLLGVEGLAEIAAAAAPVPVLAIGGITEAHIAEIRRAGAAGFAAIGLFVDTLAPPS